MKKVLRTMSILMFATAIAFLVYVLTHPEFGSVFYIGNFEIGPEIWKIFYCLYAFIMICLFAGSFFIKGKK